MRLIIAIVLGIFMVLPAFSAGKESAAELPADVIGFKNRRDLCDHFRGEEPYDKERRKFLSDSLEKYCKGTDKELAGLKVKYKDNEPVIDSLNKYEEKIEGNNFQR